MKSLCTALATVYLLLAGTALEAQEAATSVDPQDMMKLWQRWATPDEHHTGLARMLGEWDYVVKFTVPGGSPAGEKGTTVCRWTIKDRFIGCESKGTLMGQPHEAFSLNGFDKFKKAYVTVTVDSTSTALIMVEGVVVDPAGKVEALYGTIGEFLTGEQRKPVKAVRRWVNDDTWILEVWDLGTGESGQKVIEWTYTRAKKD